MEAIDSLGSFWLPGRPDDSLSGRLTFTAAGEIKLTLVGRFGHHQGEDDHDLFRIVGYVGSGPITLIDCFSVGVQHRYPGLPESRFKANKLLLGHIFEDEALEFQTIDLEFTHLDEWVERTGIKNEDVRDHDALVKVSYTPPLEHNAQFSRGAISLGHLWSYKKDLKKAEIGQRPYIRIDYGALTPLQMMLSDLGRIQSLIILCIDAPVDVDRVIVRRPDIEVRALSGAPFGSPQKIEFRAPRLRYVAIEDRKTIGTYRMLLTYAELGGIKAIAKWVDAVESFQRPLNSLMSTRNTRRIYAENRFLNVASAAEAFHRNTQGGEYMPSDEFDELLAKYLEVTPDKYKEWLNGRLRHANDAPLPRRLRKLAQQARPAARDIVDKEGRWASTISQVRNELTHLGEGPSPFKGSDLFYLSESVYSVVRICMLNSCGVPSETWLEKRDAEPMTWHKERIHRAIETVREQLGLSRSDA